MRNNKTRSEFIDYLANFVTDERKELIEQVLSSRTRYLTLVLEDIYQTQNASAVLRTCECFGLQDVHIVEQGNKFSVNRNIVRGATKWIDIHRYNHPESNNIDDCIAHLKKDGYKICATSPHSGAVDLPDFSPDEKTAFIIGHERHGLSQKALELSDVCLKIPMYGFTESYNLSVSAALILYDCIQKLKNANKNIELSEIEKEELRYNWYKISYKRADLLEKGFFGS
ncbi:TrmH family RNA methyltransferase [Marinigracilibium pacificum]|uniref:tRNA (guanosine(18)-2'-O)-methyltransferase n=1 Tax=Marinigracilibium pacificum TaxID=2729599 RepID=A0A848J1K4_9BACT|nr:RNA methyltransferase [Marinigracilibium pacificum]NMM50437.1 RNA methyltransferase [Marinigracilibium pacificum]